MPLLSPSRPNFSIVLCANQKLERKTCSKRDLHAAPSWICDRSSELSGPFMSESCRIFQQTYLLYIFRIHTYYIL